MKIKRYIILLVLVQINVQVYAQVVNKYGQQVLENVQNTLDANKPISTATQTALDLKAAIASPTFTGTPTLPTGTIGVTQAGGDTSTAIATTAFVTSAVSQNYTVTMVNSDHTILSSTSDLYAIDVSDAAVSLSLPAITASPNKGIITISDYKGNASTNNITIIPNGSDKIFGASSYIINSNYTTITLMAIPDQGVWIIKYELPAGGTEGQVIQIVNGVPVWEEVTVFYEDTDGDGYGDFTKTIVAASAPAGYVSDNTDCDDTDANINLTTTWYIDADGDGYGVSEIVYCIRPENGYLLSELSGTGTDDCNDEDANENLAQTWYIDADGDGYAGSSTTSCNRPTNGYLLPELAGTGIDDCVDSNSAISPGASESCDGIDNNCDGSVDEGLTFTTYYIDADGDGYGDANDSGTSYCSNPGSGYRITNSDCNDSNSSIKPGATEIGGNSIDENCDGNLYVVGDYVAGGVVFYVPPTPTDLNSDGIVDFGLVCSIDDLTTSSGVRFYSSNVGIPGINNAQETDRRKGFGKRNTDIIIAQLGNNTIYAPGLATAYTGGGFSDWHLPSKDELNEIYLNRVIISDTAESNGGTGFAPSNNRYWSSTATGANTGRSWNVDWTNGNLETSWNSSFYYGVRAVRVF